jgi:hypothetical protein
MGKHIVCTCTIYWQQGSANVYKIFSEGAGRGTGVGDEESGWGRIVGRLARQEQGKRVGVTRKHVWPIDLLSLAKKVR